MKAVTVGQIVDAVERWAPAGLAMPGDRIGLQIGDPAAPVEKVAVALDPSPATIEMAHEGGCQMLVTHHPLIYQPLTEIDPRDPVGAAVWKLCRAGIALLAAHTNWDVADGGINDALAGALGLASVERFGEDAAISDVKIVTFAPANAVDALIDAMTAAGAGTIGLYQRCAFTGKGTGTFEPQPGSNPAVGAVGNREAVAEMRLEMRAPSAAMAAVEQALMKAHPYDEPAYDIYPLTSARLLGLGRVGTLPEETTLGEFSLFVSKQLGSPVRYWGRADRAVRRVAVVGGAGSDYLDRAIGAGADALVTGEVRHHHTWAAEFHDVGLLDATHFGTEQPGVVALGKRIAQEFKDRLEVKVY